MIDIEKDAELDVRYAIREVKEALRLTGLIEKTLADQKEQEQDENRQRYDSGEDEDFTYAQALEDAHNARAEIGKFLDPSTEKSFSTADDALCQIYEFFKAVDCLTSTDYEPYLLELAYLRGRLHHHVMGDNRGDYESIGYYQ